MPEVSPRRPDSTFLAQIGEILSDTNESTSGRHAEIDTAGFWISDMLTTVQKTSSRPLCQRLRLEFSDIFSLCPGIPCETAGIRHDSRPNDVE